MRAGDPSAPVRWTAHACGSAGLALVVAFGVGLAVPPAERFPDTLLPAFHTFFVGLVRERGDLPARHDRDWMARARPGDVLFVSRGHVPWGEWSHAAIVVRAPDDAFWVEPGTLAVVDASIHDGIYLSPLATYREWPRVALRRASPDPAVGRRIARAALEARHALFAAVAMDGAPYSNCTKSTVDALRAAGIEPAVRGWRTPDELFRSPVWVE